MRECRALRGFRIASENMRGDGFMFGPGIGAIIQFGQHRRHRAAHVRPLRRDHFLDRRIAGEPIDRAVEIQVERDQPGQRCSLVDRASGVQRRLQIRAPGSIDLAASGRQPGRQRIDGAAHLVELADPQRIELRDFKTLAAAFGDQALAMQQMQGVADRLPGDSEFFRKLVLPDAMSRRQCAVGDGLENPRIDLIDQVGERVERDHATSISVYGIPNSKTNVRKDGVKRAG